MLGITSAVILLSDSYGLWTTATITAAVAISITALVAPWTHAVAGYDTLRASIFWSAELEVTAATVAWRACVLRTHCHGLWTTAHSAAFVASAVSAPVT